MRARFDDPPPPRSGLTAYLLCLLLGNFGIHRFYSGHIFTGLLMLLTGGGCGIWTLIDLILISTDQFRDDHGRRVQFTDANGRWPMPALIATGLVLALIGASMLFMSSVPTIALSATLMGVSAAATAAASPGIGLILVLGLGTVACVLGFGVFANVARRFFHAHQHRHFEQPYPHEAGINIHRRLGINPHHRFGFHGGGPMPPPTNYGFENTIAPPTGYGHAHGRFVSPLEGHGHSVVQGDIPPPFSGRGHGRRL